MNRAMRVRTSVAIGLAAMLAGCSASGSGSGSTPSTTAVTTVSAEAGLEWANDTVTKYTATQTGIGLDKKLTGVPAHKHVFWLEGAKVPVFTSGFKDAAAALGWDLTVVSYDDSNPQAVNTAMQQAVDQKADFIAVSGEEISQIQSALANAKAAGIPVFEAATNNEATGSGGNGIYGEVLGRDQFVQNGALIGAIAIAASQGKAHIALFNIEEITPLKNVGDGFRSTIAKYCPGCTVDTIAVANADVAAGKVPQQVASYVQSHPKVDTLAFGDGPTALGVADLLSTAGLLSKVKIVGQSPQQGNFQGLLDKKEYSWVGNPFPMVGWYTIDMMARYSVGMALENPSLPLQIFDQTNAPSPAPNYYEGPVGYPKLFKTLWGVA